jgi:hypothetical protein
MTAMEQLNEQLKLLNLLRLPADAEIDLVQF